MEELLKQILSRLEAIETEQKSFRSEFNQFREETSKRFDSLEMKLDSYHIENVEADNRLMDAIKETNDRLDFQRDKIAKTEEQVYILKQKQ